MGTGFRLIATLFWVVLLYGGAALAAGQACLNCHAEHYQERGNCVDCHLGRGDTKRKNIAHDGMLAGRYVAFTLPGSPVVRRGKDLMEKTACRRCHITGNKGNMYAANLDWSPQNATAEELFNAVREPALFMPDFHFSEEQIVALVNVIYADSRNADRPEVEVPVLIHFEDSQSGEKSVFEKECGACHRMLTKHKGGLGEGFLGPNLSGLLTEFYPENYPEEKAWTAQGLGDWLKNPRKLRKNAGMAPVALREEEWQQLKLDFMGGEPAALLTCLDSCPL